MDFERKYEKIREKNESPNDDFFDRIFEWILRGFGEGFGKLLGEIWEALEALGSFFDIIFDQVAAHLKLNQFHRKKEVPREDLEGFGDDFGRLLGEAQMHFRLEISFIEIVVLWN